MKKTVKVGDARVLKSTIQKWIAALRSGKFQQTTGVLQNETGFCCLGVACKLVIPSKKQFIDNNGRLHGSVPDRQEYAPTWLKEVDDDFQAKSDRALTTLNDNGVISEALAPFTFDEIADLLQAVYIEEVL